MGPRPPHTFRSCDGYPVIPCYVGHYSKRSAVETANMSPGEWSVNVDQESDDAEMKQEGRKDEWTRQLWHIYTVEYYSAIKENAFESVLMRWMKLEPIMQSEVSQKEKHQHSMLTAKSLQLCPTLCDPIDGSTPGYPVPGILQARTLEWVAIAFSSA